MKALKFLLPIAVIIAVMIGALQLLKSKIGKEEHHESEVAVVKVGDTLKDMSLAPLSGEQAVLLSAQAKKENAKVVLLNFWATWCSACLTEMPSIVKLREKYGPKGFGVVLVTVDNNPAEVAPPYLKKLGVTFPTFFDRDQKLAELFDVHGIPYTAILKILPSGEAKFLYREVGDRDWNAPEVHRELDGWLASQ